MRKKIFAFTMAFVFTLTSMAVPVFADDDVELSVKNEDVEVEDVITDKSTGIEAVADSGCETNVTVTDEVEVTYKGDDHVGGIGAESQGSGSSVSVTVNDDVEVEADTDAKKWVGGISVDASEGAQGFISVGDDVEVTAENAYLVNGTWSYARNGSSSQINVGADVEVSGSRNVFAVNAGAEKNSEQNTNIEGSITADRTGETGRAIGVYVASYGEGARSSVRIGGDIKGKNLGSAVTIVSSDGGAVDVVAEGTLSSGSEATIGVKGSDEDVTLTIWKAETDDDGNIVKEYCIDPQSGKGDYVRTEAAKKMEESIHYIIKVDAAQKDNIALNGTQEMTYTAPDGTVYGYDTARENERVAVKLNVPSGYTLKGVYSDEDRQVSLQRDECGNYYLIVPKGGGIYVNMWLVRDENDDKDDDDDKKDNNKIVASPVSTGTYATTEAFGTAGVSMISSAASGSTVTIDATSFTSLPASIVASLMARPDVTFVFTYMLNGLMYKVTIPAGTDLAALLNASGGIDFASLAAYTSTAA